MSVTLHTTLGEIPIELYHTQCPKAAENFLALCASSYYDGCLFHRVIPGFIIQSGDPTGTGKGGSSIWNRPFADEIVPELKKHDRPGIVSMANSGPNTNNSQFFITLSPQEHLDTKYTAFGRVTGSGMSVVEAINQVPVNEKHQPLSPVAIEKIVIHFNPIAELES